MDNMVLETVVLWIVIVLALLMVMVLVRIATMVTASLPEEELPYYIGKLKDFLSVKWRSYLIAFVGLAVVGNVMYYRDQVGLLDIANILACLSLLIVVAWTDLKYKIIPNKIMVLGLGICLGLLVLKCIVENARMCLVSSGIGALAMVVITMMCRLLNPKNIGFGDVKLLSVLGLFLGAENMFQAGFAMMVLMFVACVVLLLMKKVSRESELPLAPFALGGVLMMVLL